MTIKIADIDVTKSITWQSLEKDIQDTIVNACLERQNLDPVKNDNEGLTSADVNFCNKIHEALGCTRMHYARLIFELEYMAMSAEGGIFEPIKQYVRKYREIESAALTTARERGIQNNRER